MPKYQSTKVFDGFSCCFRQWKATTTHCQFLHGYGISFKVTFEGKLDDRNWVWDYMFDHTVLVAEDDPMLMKLQSLDQGVGKQFEGCLQLRIVKATGAEKFAELLFDKLNNFVKDETSDRVRVTQVEFMEHGKNTAIYSE